MAWDFKTDPDYQAQLDWVDTFLTEEIEPLDLILGDPYDKSDERALAHSFTWVTASSGDELVGFVNVAWDGDTHFFLLDTTVHPNWQRRGIGRRLVEEAIEACRGHGEWLHVDASEELMTRFYLRCGFESTPAGLADLRR